MSHESKSSGEYRWYDADGADLIALAKLLEPYQAEATIGGRRVLLVFYDAETADQCEEEMSRHWMLCIRKMVLPRQSSPGRHG